MTRTILHHIAGVLHLPLLWLIAAVLNSQMLGWYVGGAIDSLSDPLVIILALVLGLLIRRPDVLAAVIIAVAAILAFALPLHDPLAGRMEPLGSFSRASALATIASGVALLRCLLEWRMRKNRRSDPSPG